MNYKLGLHNIKSPQTYSVNISQCGLLTCFGECKSVPRLYDNYVLTFVIKGMGTYKINDVVYTVKEGQAMLTTPNTLTSWTTDNENPWQYVFIMLSGVDCKNFLVGAGLGDKCKIFDYSLNNNVKENLLKIYETSANDDSYYECMSYFYKIIHYTAKTSIGSKSIKKSNDYLESAIIFIENNYCHNISISDISKHLNIERTYLYKIFSRELGISPMRFLTDYRLTKAIEMMQHFNLSAATIATMVGFYDFSHFSRLFSKKYGTTPGKYRKQKEIEA